MKDELWQKVLSLDFTTVKAKLKKEKGLFWKWRNDLDKLENQYRQFLYLIAANPTEMVIPWSQALDDFWHQHILDTKKYTDECNLIFGKYIHHNPHVPQGSNKHKDAYGKTKEMYKEAFGPKAKTSEKNRDTDGSSCGAGCGSAMPVVFCGSVVETAAYSPVHTSHSDSSSHGHSSHSDSSSHGHSSCGSSTSSGGSSCGSSSGGGSSCGSSCGGGGGGCGGGGGD